MVTDNYYNNALAAVADVAGHKGTAEAQGGASAA